LEGALCLTTTVIADEPGTVLDVLPCMTELHRDKLGKGPIIERSDYRQQDNDSYRESAKRPESRST
jgi:hypothetical protein